MAFEGYPPDAVARYRALEDLINGDANLSELMRQVALSVLGDWMGTFGKLPSRPGFFWSPTVVDAYAAILDRAAKELDAVRSAKRAAAISAKEHARLVRAERHRNWTNTAIFLVALVLWFLLLGAIAIFLDINLDSPRGDRLLGIYMAVSFVIGLLLERARSGRR